MGCHDSFADQVVYADDDALEATTRISECFQPVLVADNARKDSLVISKKDERELERFIMSAFDLVMLMERPVVPGIQM